MNELNNHIQCSTIDIPFQDVTTIRGGLLADYKERVYWLTQDELPKLIDTADDIMISKLFEHGFNHIGMVLSDLDSQNICLLVLNLIFYKQYMYLVIESNSSYNYDRPSGYHNETKHYELYYAFNLHNVNG